MQLPTVIFKINPDRVAESMVFFLTEPNDFAEEAHKIVSHDHRSLIHQLQNQPKETQQQMISDYVGKFYAENKNEIEQAKNKIESVWGNVEKKVGESLAMILETDWDGIQDITGNVGIMQLCPRDLDELSFQFYYHEYPFESLATVLHEITHFIYFKKWKELFPKDSDDMFESPHPYWHLSEILAPILNNETVLKQLIPDAETHGYHIYNDRPYDSESMQTSIQGFFTQKYLEYKNQGRSIADFLKDCRSNVEKMKFYEGSAKGYF